MGNYDPHRVRQFKRPHGLPFHIGKIGHVVINVRDVERSARFYTEVLGFEISDVYPEEMVPGGMVFLRCNTDHHGIALVGSMTARGRECRAQPHRLRGREPRRCRARARSSAPPWGGDRFRRASPRRLPARGRIPRPRQPPARNLLGHRPDRQRWPGPAANRMEGCAHSRRCSRQPGTGPRHQPARPVVAGRAARAGLARRQKRFPALVFIRRGSGPVTKAASLWLERRPGKLASPVGRGGGACCSAAAQIDRSRCRFLPVAANGVLDFAAVTGALA